MGTDEQTTARDGDGIAGVETGNVIATTASTSRYYALYTHPWFQVVLISVICFCCPGMYNALTGLGGSGQVDSTVAANATVALLAATAASALFIVGPIFGLLGPRLCWMIGGWTYALYAGSLLAFDSTANGGFVIASGAILGIGASFLWVSQGAIMTTYVPESQKGRAIALFWIIFNFGGGVGALASFGLNFNSTSGTVSNSTYIALMVIMAFGWVIGVFICPPSKVRMVQLREAEQEIEQRSLAHQFRLAVKIMLDWRVALMLPLFFCANIFYSYQQNNVNGYTFDIRTRSLNSALYWFAQMFGGLLMGGLLDLPGFNRRHRAQLGWTMLLVTGMVIWGGGYAFQKWEDVRLARGLKQDVDYTQSDISSGPMFLYIFYGAYDALWQGFSYWLIGTQSNSAAVTAILVAAYKTFQATGAAMAWRINALAYSGMTQLAIDWGMCIGSLVIVAPTVWTVTMTSTDHGDAVRDLKEAEEE